MVVINKLHAALGSHRVDVRGAGTLVGKGSPLLSEAEVGVW